MLLELDEELELRELDEELEDELELLEEELLLELEEELEEELDEELLLWPSPFTVIAGGVALPGLALKPKLTLPPAGMSAL